MKAETEKTEDFKEFGDGWVYCRQHMRPHKTGWCTVPVREKVLLFRTTEDKEADEDEAYRKCRYFGLKLYEDVCREIQARSSPSKGLKFFDCLVALKDGSIAVGPYPVWAKNEVEAKELFIEMYPTAKKYEDRITIAYQPHCS
jgi:hypothetical protein